jgi:hypothetical protein
MLEWYEEAGITVSRSPASPLGRIKAEIVLWLTPEQIVEPAYLQKALDFLQTNPQFGFVTCGLLRNHSSCVPASAERPAILACAHLPFPMIRRTLLERTNVNLVDGSCTGREMTLRLLDSGVQGVAFADSLICEVSADNAGPGSGGSQHGRIRTAAAAYERYRHMLDASWRDVVLEYQARRRSAPSESEISVNLSANTSPRLMSPTEAADS